MDNWLLMNPVVPYMAIPTSILYVLYVPVIVRGTYCGSRTAENMEYGQLYCCAVMNLYVRTIAPAALQPSSSLK